MAYSADGITWTAIGNTRFGVSPVEGVGFSEKLQRAVAVGYDGKGTIL
jgi:hypothetical protein